MSTYAKAKEFIKTATERSTFYDGIRAILKEDMAHYPEDWQVKELQRLADAKYEELSADKQHEQSQDCEPQPEVARKRRGR